VASVADLVLATQHQAPTPATIDPGTETSDRETAEGPGTNDTAVVLDADLAILAAEPSRYQAYATGVRAEYAHVDDASWRTGRTRVLRAFLERPAIYLTAPMQRQEHRARANLAAELSSLAAP
jgi:predicted metal-dependent HD superfamily phosphohydrolase